MILFLIVLVVLVIQLAPSGATDPPARQASGAPDSGRASEREAPASGDEVCPLATEGSGIAIAMSGCTVIASDTSARPDPLPFWGQIACEDASRHRQITEGGDTHPRADGAPQPDRAFRRLTAIDGDDYYGERCELGDNDRPDSPTIFYEERQRRATFLSVRLPSDFPLDDDVFQVVMQMKQTQPADNGGGTPVLALEAFDGRWRLRQSDSTGPADDAHDLWSAPAQSGVWTRFAFDITYSDDPSSGRISVYTDLNGDSDFDDSDERSGVIETFTLKTESADGGDGLSEGEPIPSHLRAGLYHNPEYSCPGPGGCHLDVDNVQVLGP